jgi:hypothetical protein
LLFLSIAMAGFNIRRCIPVIFKSIFQCWISFIGWSLVVIGSSSVVRRLNFRSWHPAKSLQHPKPHYKTKMVVGFTMLDCWIQYWQMYSSYFQIRFLVLN